ncbi:MAG: RDD family protein [Thermoleophilaceae bacterium]
MPKPLPPAVQGRELASWGSRVGALLLDRLIEIGIGLALSLVLLLPGILLVDGDSTAIGVVLLILFGLVFVAVALVWEPYFMNREGEHNGQTIGKQMVGITVVRDQGERMDFGWAFVRQILVIQGIPWALNIFAAIFIIPIGTLGLLLDYLWPLWDDENRCVHDMIVKTHVVRV